MIRLLCGAVVAAIIGLLCLLLSPLAPAFGIAGAVSAGIGLTCLAAAPVAGFGWVRSLGVAAALTIAFSPFLAAYAADGPVVTIPYGDLISEGAHIASAVLVPLVLALLAKLTGPVGLFLRAHLGDKLIRNAVDYAVNAVQGAAKGKTLSVTVGSQVLAKALQYALDQGAPWLVSALGGPEGVKLKIFRALDLESEASVGLLARTVVADLRA